jgi:hypothetical protein
MEPCPRPRSNFFPTSTAHGSPREVIYALRVHLDKRSESRVNTELASDGASKSGPTNHAPNGIFKPAASPSSATPARKAIE